MKDPKKKSKGRPGGSDADAELMCDEPDLDIEAEFHGTVKTLAADTVDLLKDDKALKKALKRGEFEEVAEYVYILAEIQPQFDNDDIVRATSKKNGLMKLAVDADYESRLRDLAYKWLEVTASVDRMPSLTWPVVKV